MDLKATACAFMRDHKNGGISMNKQTVIGALAAIVLLLGGYAVYAQFFQRSADDTDTSVAATDAGEDQAAADVAQSNAPSADAGGNGPRGDSDVTPEDDAVAGKVAARTAPATAARGRQADCSISIANWNASTMSTDPAQEMNKRCTVTNEGAEGGFTLTANGGGTLMMLGGERVTKVVMHSDGMMDVFIDGRPKYGYGGLTTGKFGQCYNGNDGGSEVMVCAGAS